MEGFYVIAPATVETKVRGKFEVFDERWKSLREQIEGEPVIIVQPAPQQASLFDVAEEVAA